MNRQKILVALLGVALVTFAYRAYGWGGIALVVGGIVMWMLLNFTRAVTVLQRAAKTPVGYVGSAVMLNAKLKPRVTLLHVIALTRSLGELRSPKGAQPEIYRWTDGSASHVTCEFQDGKLVRWELVRPVALEGDASDAAPVPQPRPQPPPAVAEATSGRAPSNRPERG